MQGETGNLGETEYIKVTADLIEQNLEAFGIFVKVVEIDIKRADYEFYLDVSVGTPSTKLEKYNRDLAVALASTTGRVKWHFPIPGRRQVGLIVPKPSPEYWRQQRSLRNLFGLAFFLLGRVNYWLASKIIGGPITTASISSSQARQLC
jgi:DNA segregation ATPase FtsK/SpoIIIE-like protein